MAQWRARTAIVTTVATTADNMMKMNQAARLAALGEGWVMPMVLIKAFEMKWRSFTVIRWDPSAMVAGYCRRLAESEEGVSASYWNEGLPGWWQAHTLKDV